MHKVWVNRKIIMSDLFCSTVCFKFEGQAKYVQCFVVQRDTFEKVKHSLNLIYDEHFLLPSKTRYSEFDKLDTSRKLPSLLRCHSHFTTLVIRETHEKVFHNGVHSTLNFLRNKYWLIRGR